MSLVPTRTLAAPALCVAAIAVAVLLGWGFTVDDALISARVAYHLQQGVGYRFNPDGPVVDCVTPLGWAFVLWPAASSVLDAFAFARLVGLCSAFATALVLAYHLRSVSLSRLPWVLLPLALCLPLGAWVSSGMETPLVMALVAFGLGPGKLAMLGTSAAAALRPELVPYAVSVAVLQGTAREPSSVQEPAGRRARLFYVLLALSLPCAVTLARVWVFGQPAPLAVLAKPSDFDSGLRYAVGGSVLLGLPCLLLAWAAWARVPARVRAFAIACVVHVAALLVAGGDWMALFRLFVPIVPPLVFVAAELAAASKLWHVIVRSAVASLIALALLLVKGPEARGVLAHRLALVQAAGPALTGSFHVATLDVGWVGATTRAPVLDLAGLTDVDVAILPGGHTSKQLPSDFLVRRAPDTLVLLLRSGVTEAQAKAGPWTELPFARAVEQRLTRLEGANEFVPVATLPLGGTEQRYLVLRRLTQRVVLAR